MTTVIEAAFEQHRRELHVHCYRMLASYDEAEDAVQETYLRAWRSRDDVRGRAVRAWLYRIATNVCVDAIRAQKRQVPRMHVVRRGAVADAVPGQRCSTRSPGSDAPDDVAVARETIELAFLAALQVLPPRQRAALLAREVLGLPAAETARLLGTVGGRRPTARCNGPGRR